MNRNASLTLMVISLALLMPQAVPAEGTQTPHAKAAAPKSVQGTVPEAPQRVVEAPLSFQLVKADSRFALNGPGTLTLGGDTPFAARPIGGHTTIAPFPVPGESSSAAKERWKTLNLPKTGVTTIAPMPAPPGAISDPDLEGNAILRQQVDVLPEATNTLAPSYPKAARDAGIQGTVRVAALVRTDGTVDSAKVFHSIPGLDEAALECVKQWRFKPASFHGKPVKVWVGIPVKFTLH